jgi:uncharacterized protein
MIRRAAPWLALLLLLAALAVPAVAAEPAFPPLTGRVVDEAGILSPETEARLAAQLEAQEKQTSNQVVVVTLKSLQGYDIADYGYRLGRHWGIGTEQRNNGVLLIVAPNETAVRIEVGYGLEGTLTDALSSNIIQTAILPAFRAGNYDSGVEAGVSAILAAIAGTYEPVPAQEEAPDWLFLILFGILFTLVMVRGHRTQRRRGIGLGGLMLMGGLGRGSGGGFGGGLFGGGGGSFGGGGASGRW